MKRHRTKTNAIRFEKKFMLGHSRIARPAGAPLRQDSTRRTAPLKFPIQRQGFRIRVLAAVYPAGRLDLRSGLWTAAFPASVSIPVRAPAEWAPRPRGLFSFRQTPCRHGRPHLRSRQVPHHVYRCRVGRGQVGHKERPARHQGGHVPPQDPRRRDCLSFGTSCAATWASSVHPSGTARVCQSGSTGELPLLLPANAYPAGTDPAGRRSVTAMELLWPKPKKKLEDKNLYYITAHVSGAGSADHCRTIKPVLPPAAAPSNYRLPDRPMVPRLAPV